MKRHLFSLAAIVIAVVGTAFSVENKANSIGANEKRTTTDGAAGVVEVWEFVCGDPLNPSNYQRGFWQPSCIGVGAVCCIVAEEDMFNPGYPNITPYLQFEILSALAFSIETNHVMLKFN